MRKFLLRGFSVTAIIGLGLALFIYLGGLVSGNSLLSALQAGLRPPQDTISTADNIEDRLSNAFDSADALLTPITNDLEEGILPLITIQPESQEQQSAPDPQNNANVKNDDAESEAPRPKTVQNDTSAEQTPPPPGQATPIDAAAISPDAAPIQAREIAQTEPDPLGSLQSELIPQITEQENQAPTGFNTTNIDVAGFPDNAADQNPLLDDAEPLKADWKAELLQAHEQEMLKMQLEHERRITADRFERSYGADKTPFGQSNFQISELTSKPSQYPVQATPNSKDPDAAPGKYRTADPSLMPEHATVQRATLPAGSLIPAVLTNEIQSELPGIARALVTRDVFDEHYKRVLIPQGSVLLGKYDHNTSQNQERLFVVMDRVRFPDGSILDLEGAPAVDQQGGAGLTGKRKSNFLTAIFQGTLLNMASNAARGASVAQDASDLERAARIATGQSIGSVAEQHMESVITRGARFTIPAGTRFNVQVNKDYHFSALDHSAQKSNFANAKYQTPHLIKIKSKSGAQNATIPPYKREDYDHWIDEDGDCQNLRHELLEKASTGTNLQKSLDGCYVKRGRWLDPYSGKIFTKASELHIDHVVPLAWAHYRGAGFFDADRKRQFANDPANLLIVSASLNMSKGAQSPLKWLPPHKAFQCQYIVRFNRIVKKYALTVSSSETKQFNALQQRLCGT